ncbi:uncharacterized protein LOC131151377 [Malania oleifera]|uniref:uncharacterized protein LOC131151377 n=1 Tax=Malania oleifera TaxID=397392 RepID=UPI0025AE9A09|nr:uncharacterized protein LOC131151377 [Malania oleifera]
MKATTSDYKSSSELENESSDQDVSNLCFMAKDAEGNSYTSSSEESSDESCSDSCESIPSYREIQAILFTLHKSDGMKSGLSTLQEKVTSIETHCLHIDNRVEKIEQQLASSSKRKSPMSISSDTSSEDDSGNQEEGDHESEQEEGTNETNDQEEGDDESDSMEASN